MKKLTLLAVLVCLIGVFFLAGGNELLALDNLREHVDELRRMAQERPLLTIVGFFLAYVCITSLSLPGATVMTLGAGAVFGLWKAALIVSFASSLGALLAFALARSLLRDWVQRKYANKLATVNEGLARDGAYYLFMLRLIPLFPFFMINLLMGLTPLNAARFYWVSQLGMLPGTLLYVNAGFQLANISSPADVLSGSVVLSLTLLALVPLTIRQILRYRQHRRIYSRWRKPARFDRNLIVIGAGAAGLVSAYIGATVKAKVTLVEAHKMGGDCLNYGCVPSKALIKSARIAKLVSRAGEFGVGSHAPTIVFKSVMQRVLDIIAQVEPHDSAERFTTLGVDVVQGHATLVDPWTVEITGNDGGKRRLTSRGIVIAAGAAPVVPDLPGLEAVGYVTSDTLWEACARLETAPERLVVLGGGPIGCELSQAFARLGLQVTQIERGARVMAREEVEVSEYVHNALQGDGVEILTNTTALRCELRDGEKRIIVGTPAGERAVAFDLLLCAVGRQARLSGYGLENLGIETGRTVTTNARLQTLYPNIFAAGDVAGPYQFTHTAAHQAWYASVNALFGPLVRFKVDYRVIPSVTFTDPEIARVGLDEPQAKSRDVAYEVTRFSLSELDRAITDGVAHGYVKVLTALGSDRILGVTIVGEHAGEMLAEFTLAMRHGIGLNKILGTIHPYPTLAEANKYVAGEWKRGHAPARLLSLVRRFHDYRRGPA